MRRLRVDSWKALAWIVPMTAVLPAFGISCMTQSQMGAPQRTALRDAAQSLAVSVKAGDRTAVRAQTLPPVAAQFGGIADSIESVSPDIQHAALTVDNLYSLNATELKAPEDAQFFCGLPGSPLTVEINIPGLPPGQYALVIVRATGVEHPQQLSMVLANDPAGSATWKLAGFFTRSMTMGGHDGVWFWQHAREYAAKKQLWDAWFYYQTAQFLLDPVDFLSSPNLEKLHREAEQTRPEGLPGTNPLRLSADGQTYEITNLHTGELSNQFDLIVNYKSKGNLDPVAARAQVTAVMRALLQQHPELQSAFHGLWVYAGAPDQHPFALELPMDQIQASASGPQHSKRTDISTRQSG